MATKRTAPAAPVRERPATEARPVQKNLSAAEKLAILAAYESYPRGDTRRGELLRRHGLYTSYITKWREQRDRGSLQSNQQPTAGRPALARDPQLDEIARLRAENARLQAELDKAQFVISIQKKVATLLGEATSRLPSSES